MATIKFYIQSKIKWTKIYVRLRDGISIDAKAKTNFMVDPNNWSPSKGELKSLKDENYKQLNQDLLNFKINLLNHFNKCSNKEIINSTWLKNFINPIKIEVEIPTKLVDYFEYYSLHHKNTLTKATHTKINVNKRLIERFQKKTKMVYLIKDVDSNFKLNFENYCYEEQYSPNTVARTIKFIKTICYHAKGNGIETHFQLEGIKTKVEKVDKIYLNKDEIQKLLILDLQLPIYDTARDWLIISCETGQRVSDFLKFNKKSIREEGNVSLIEFTQVKTKKRMSIPVSKKVQLILNKRGGEFPNYINSVDYNKLIKTICKLAGFDYLEKGSKQRSDIQRREINYFPKFQLVASHIGRRSFASNYYGVIPTPLLMSATGHTTEKAFLEYIGKSETVMAKHLAHYFEKLEI